MSRRRRRSPKRHTVHTQNARYSISQYSRGTRGTPPESTASKSWIEKWEREREKYIRLGIPLSKLRERIIRHKASLILSREFGEDPEAFKERRGLKEYYEWDLNLINKN